MAVTCPSTQINCPSKHLENTSDGFERRLECLRVGSSHASYSYILALDLGCALRESLTALNRFEILGDLCEDQQQVVMTVRRTDGDFMPRSDTEPLTLISNCFVIVNWVQDICRE